MPDQTILDLNLEETPELIAVDDGEYQIEVTQAELRHKEETDSRYIFLRFDIPQEPHFQGGTHVIMLPSADDDEKQQIRRKNAIKRAAEAFGVDYSNGLDVEHFEGQTAWVVLDKQETPDYGVQNNIKRFVTGA